MLTNFFERDCRPFPSGLLDGHPKPLALYCIARRLIGDGGAEFAHEVCWRPIRMIEDRAIHCSFQYR
jgi:hypothetical protein